MTRIEGHGALLSGLDGGNPLGFLAAIGVLQVLSDSNAEALMAWQVTPNGWRPYLTGCGDDQDQICLALQTYFCNSPTAIFDIGKTLDGQKQSNKFPFDAEKFVNVLKAAVAQAHLLNRREVDFLAAFGSELHPDKDGLFQCTQFKMVRSGDSNSQGMLFYAKKSQKDPNIEILKRTLFLTWEYQDDGYSLRWDPIEDQRYALRWRNPSQSSVSEGPGTMIAANALAVEALRCFPAVPIGKEVSTTGFQRLESQVTFVWPIWTRPSSAHTVRSLLSIPDLGQTPLRRSELKARGVEEVFGVRRVQPNKYYYNFAPALPIS